MWIKEQGKITQGFYSLGTFSNPVYLLNMEKEWVLIEAGLEINVALLLDQLNEILPDLSLLKHWLITHSHYDHCGSIEPILSHIPWIKLYASEEAIQNFALKKYAVKVRQLNRMIPTSQSLHRENLPEKALHELSFMPLSEGILSLCGREDWLVLPTPGHSKCSLSLYYVPKKILFVSDALGEIIAPDKWFPLAFESMASYMKSISALEAYETDYLALGHYGILSGKEAKYAAAFSLQSCHDMIRLANQVLSTQGISSVNHSIDKEFGTNDRNFIPDHVYTKSITQLINVLTTENYINSNYEN
jgi:2-aminobenzoylacetyl-CoA thioesterase